MCQESALVRDLLLRKLRTHALKRQRDNPRPFLSLRQAARRFDASLATVATAYGQLEREGLLKRIRSSRTVLQPHGSSRQISVNAVVALPMPLSLFMTKQKSRLFFMRVRDELQERGFFPVAVFYDASEAQPDFLRQRIAHANADIVLWYMPDRCARETALLLRDVGVRVLGLADGGAAAMSCRYHIRREKAAATILQNWKSSSNIRRVTIVRSSNRIEPEEGWLRKLLRNEELSAEIVSARQKDDPGKFLVQLAKIPETGIILTGTAASYFSYRVPQMLTELMLRCRVGLIDGPISLPFAENATARADFAIANWEEVAAGVTRDLLDPDRDSRVDNIVFEAEAYLETSLARFAQIIDGSYP